MFRLDAVEVDSLPLDADPVRRSRYEAAAHQYFRTYYAEQQYEFFNIYRYRYSMGCQEKASVFVRESPVQSYGASELGGTCVGPHILCND